VTLKRFLEAFEASWLNILFCGGAMSTVVVSLPVFVVFPPQVSVRHI
jgi:hypothetical protein